MHRIQLKKSVRRSKFLFLLLFLFLFVYVIAGFTTEFQLIYYKTSTNTVFEDFNIYKRAALDAFNQKDPYAIRKIGPGFLYPPPSLLVLEIFSHLKSYYLQQSFYTVINILMMALMIFGISRYYKLQTRQVWYWYVLCFGYAPFLELLTVGQINMFTLFGIFILFLFENRNPIIGGIGISLSIITKVTPILFFGYLIVNQKFKLFITCLITIIFLFVLVYFRYGQTSIIEYPGVFSDLTNAVVLDLNSHSLSSKIIGIVGSNRFTSLLNKTSPIFRPFFISTTQMIIQKPQTIQQFVQTYIIIVISISALLSYGKPNSKEPVFIITIFGMTISPNIMWYHHYVFLLLPILIWISWRRENILVLVWNLIGLFVIQIDRWIPPYGLLIHLFCHISILFLLLEQISETIKIKSKDKSIALIQV